MKTELDLNESLGKRRIAEWNKAHKHLYDGRKYYNRSEEYQQEYIDLCALHLAVNKTPVSRDTYWDMLKLTPDAIRQYKAAARQDTTPEPLPTPYISKWQRQMQRRVARDERYQAERAGV